MRLIHTSDWHIGRSFTAIGDERKRALLQEARLDAITTIGRLACEHGAAHVLVAGDVFDAIDVGARGLREPIERMRPFESVSWHLLPGNHDPDRPGGTWERLLRQSVLPAHVVIHREPGPFEIAAGAWLLPAPLKRRAEGDDPTAWMESATTPAGAFRIGLAHGSIAGLAGQESRRPTHPIAADRVARAGLAYLALGDWHDARRIDGRCWYAGTPEPLGFGGAGDGAALLVELRGEAEPDVRPLPVGHYGWRTERAVLDGRAAIDALASRVKALAPGDDLAHLCLRLEVEGALSLSERLLFDEQIVAWLDAALAHLRLDTSKLGEALAEDDLATIGAGGAIRLAAERLARRARDERDPERDLARLALRRLLIEQRREGHP